MTLLMIVVAELMCCVCCACTSCTSYETDVRCGQPSDRSGHGRPAPRSVSPGQVVVSGADVFRLKM